MKGNILYKNRVPLIYDGETATNKWLTYSGTWGPIKGGWTGPWVEVPWLDKVLVFMIFKFPNFSLRSKIISSRASYPEGLKFSKAVN